MDRKYPAINGFDYGHMPASKAGANWINYKDITPVKNWSDNHGIVQMMWHWNVPKNEPQAGKGIEMLSDWSANLQLTNDAVKAAIGNAQVGDKLVATISDVADGAQGSIKILPGQALQTKLVPVGNTLISVETNIL